MDEDDTIFDYPHEVLKAALAWVPRDYLYHGVTEMVDHLVVDTEEDHSPPPITETEIQDFISKLGLDKGE